MDNPVKIRIGTGHSPDAMNGVEYGSVMLASECPPDLREGGWGEFLGQVHGDLARSGDLPAVALLPE